MIDRSQPPIGIIITFGKVMMLDNGGVKRFLSSFFDSMSSDDDYWHHFSKNRPSHDIAYVYIIICNRLAYRCQFGGYYTEGGCVYGATGQLKECKNSIILAGPVVRCPFKQKMRGFQGFRYVYDKLF